MNEEVRVIILEGGAGLKPEYKLVLLSAAILANEKGVAAADLRDWARLTGMDGTRTLDIIRTLAALGVWRMVEDDPTDGVAVDFISNRDTLEAS